MRDINALFLVLVFSSLIACGSSEEENISPEYLSMITSKPIVELEGVDSESKSPPEKVASYLVSYLEESKKPNNIDIAQQIKQCTASMRLEELKTKSSCYVEGGTDDDSDQRCALEKAYWKNNLSKNLYSVATDLNHDNTPDYIISGQSCTGLANSYTFTYFVLLSQKNKAHKIVLSSSDSAISVTPVIKNGANVIITRGYVHSDSRNLWFFDGHTYRNENCFYRPNDNSNGHFKKTACFKE